MVEKRIKVYLKRNELDNLAMDGYDFYVDAEEVK